MSNEITTTREGGTLAAPGLDPSILAATQLGKDGVEVLKELRQMRADDRKADAEAAFNRAMSLLHGALGSIQKNRSASFKTKSGANVSYRYADLHAIATALRAHTGGLGLSWSWNTEYADNCEIVTCIVAHEAGHARKSSWRAPIEQDNPMTSAPQKAKIATTFAQRVTLVQAFGLTDTEDDVDGQMPADAPAAPAGPPITDDEARELEALIDTAAEGRAEGWADRQFANLYRAKGIAALSELPAADFGEVLSLFKRVAASKKVAP